MGYTNEEMLSEGPESLADSKIHAHFIRDIWLKTKVKEESISSTGDQGKIQRESMIDGSTHCRMTMCIFRNSLALEDI